MSPLTIGFILLNVILMSYANTSCPKVNIYYVIDNSGSIETKDRQYNTMTIQQITGYFPIADGNDVTLIGYGNSGTTFKTCSQISTDQDVIDGYTAFPNVDERTGTQFGLQNALDEITNGACPSSNKDVVIVLGQGPANLGDENTLFGLSHQIQNQYEMFGLFDQ